MEDIIKKDAGNIRIRGSIYANISNSQALGELKMAN